MQRIQNAVVPEIYQYSRNCCLLVSERSFPQLELIDIGRNCLLGNKKKIAKFLMRTFTYRSTFLYGSMAHCLVKQIHFLTHKFQDPSLCSSTSAGFITEIGRKGKNMALIPYIQRNGKQKNDFFPSTCCLFYIEDLF